jgi:hypothetical protein
MHKQWFKDTLFIYKNKMLILRYVYGKPVAGTARLSLNVTYPWGGSNYLFDVNRKEVRTRLFLSLSA